VGFVVLSVSLATVYSYPLGLHRKFNERFGLWSGLISYLLEAQCSAYFSFVDCLACNTNFRISVIHVNYYSRFLILLIFFIYLREFSEITLFII